MAEPQEIPEQIQDMDRGALFVLDADMAHLINFNHPGAQGMEHPPQEEPDVSVKPPVVNPDLPPDMDHPNKHSEQEKAKASNTRSATSRARSPSRFCTD